MLIKFALQVEESEVWKSFLIPFKGRAAGLQRELQVLFVTLQKTDKEGFHRIKNHEKLLGEI